MNLTPSYLSEVDRQVLQRAREVFGSTTQILVAVEELCELSTVCAKYPRYDDKQEAIQSLYSKALDECADVIVVLDHICSIFQLNEEDLRSRIRGKVARLSLWLDKSDSMDITTKEREVPQQSGCAGCKRVGDWDALSKGICQRCYAGTENGHEPQEQPNT